MKSHLSLKRLLLPHIVFLFLLVIYSYRDLEAKTLSVFLPGLGEDADRWKIYSKNLRNKDYLITNSQSLIRSKTEFKQVAAFFQYSDSNAGIFELVDELKDYLDKNRNQFETIRLIGFSYGGVIARAYLAIHNDEMVSKLISISSPHLGSNWSYLFEFVSKIDYLCFVEKQFYSNQDDAFFCSFEKRLYSTGLKASLDSKAIEDLTPPLYKVRFIKKGLLTKYEHRCLAGFHNSQTFELQNFLKIVVDSCGLSDSGLRKSVKISPLNVMASLSMAKHPNQTEYVNFISSIEAARDNTELLLTLRNLLEELSEGNLLLSITKAKIINELKNLIGGLTQSKNWMESGDGAVGKSSQNMSNLNFFKDLVEEKRIVKNEQVITLRNFKKTSESNLPEN